MSGAYDEEVVAATRREFDRIDKDKSGSLDADECLALLQALTPGASRRDAENLLNQLDTDRSGGVGFEEFLNRFGRKLQMDLAARKRAVRALPPGSAVTLTGLSVTTLNGRAAKCVELQEDKGRWNVRLDGTNEVKSIKYANLAPVQAPASAESQRASSPRAPEAARAAPSAPPPPTDEMPRAGRTGAAPTW